MKKPILTSFLGVLLASCAFVQTDLARFPGQTSEFPSPTCTLFFATSTVPENSTIAFFLKKRAPAQNEKSISTSGP
jgi:hypothetical protein